MIRVGDSVKSSFWAGVWEGRNGFQGHRPSRLWGMFDPGMECGKEKLVGRVVT